MNSKLNEKKSFIGVNLYKHGIKHDRIQNSLDWRLRESSLRSSTAIDTQLFGSILLKNATFYFEELR